MLAVKRKSKGRLLFILSGNRNFPCGYKNHLEFALLLNVVTLHVVQKYYLVYLAFFFPLHVEKHMMVKFEMGIVKSIVKLSLAAQRVLKYERIIKSNLLFLINQHVYKLESFVWAIQSIDFSREQRDEKMKRNL